MDILVTVDRNYLRPLSVMLKSLAVHHRHVPVRVFILHRSLLPEDLRALEQAVGEPELELVSLPAGAMWPRVWSGSMPSACSRKSPVPTSTPGSC